MNAQDFCIGLMSKLMMDDIDEINIDDINTRKALEKLYNYDFPFAYLFNPINNFKILYKEFLSTHRVGRYGNSIFFSITKDYARSYISNIIHNKYIDMCVKEITSKDIDLKEDRESCLLAKTFEPTSAYYLTLITDMVRDGYDLYIDSSIIDGKTEWLINCCTEKITETGYDFYKVLEKIKDKLQYNFENPNPIDLRKAKNKINQIEEIIENYKTETLDNQVEFNVGRRDAQNGFSPSRSNSHYLVGYMVGENE